MIGLLILGIIDILAGILLGLRIAHDITFYLGIFMVIKAAWTILTSIAGGFYFEIPGFFDLFGGLSMISLTIGINSDLFIYLGLALIIKGAYSLIISLMSD